MQSILIWYFLLAGRYSAISRKPGPIRHNGLLGRQTSLPRMSPFILLSLQLLLLSMVSYDIEYPFCLFQSADLASLSPSFLCILSVLDGKVAEDAEKSLTVLEVLQNY